MRCKFHPEALAEYDDAVAYYAGCQPGLEIRFMDSVEAAINRICDSPQRWRVFDGEIRRYLVRVFPYAVLYSIEEDCIFLIAVMHCSREPGYWKKRLSPASQGQT